MPCKIKDYLILNGMMWKSPTLLFEKDIPSVIEFLEINKLMIYTNLILLLSFFSFTEADIF